LAGKKDASFVMRKIGLKTGLTAAKTRATIVKHHEKKMTKIAPEEGLAFLLNNKKNCEEQFRFGSQNVPNCRTKWRPSVCHPILQVWL
jgi:hypothetical protein